MTKKTVFCLIIFINFTVLPYPYEKITVLTGPIGRSSSKGYGGHKAVTRSLIEGFKKLRVNFNYNPSSINDLGDVVVVLSNIGALKQAFKLRQEGRIKRLLAGPNLMIRATDHGRVLDAPHFDMYLVNSDWTWIAYQQDLPSLKNRIDIWPAGIDPEYWKPIPQKNKNDNKNVLVYVKMQGKSLQKPVEDILKKYDWNPISLVYGKYDHTQFRQALSKSRFSVFLSRHESQGLALAESWAMDVPTLPWNIKFLNAHGRKYNPSSACPFLSNMTGEDWANLEEFEAIIKNIESKLQNFSPREWVLENMTDEACANILLNIIESME